ncbi:protein NCBP2AS2 homolog [Rhipicephalus sanguineus]|uniref:protein NCBP2AS2 homolog n=1 Tax=Rhipicephalus sanguineus TaxID=34632 RepID=UPI001894F491|nr:protein NCBP2AS2 homolog [Rhipicephalus sanguineus]XP_037517712.1 protein NCBP2AS2 homolog [Rhipicephalus sanguineus]
MVLRLLLRYLLHNEQLIQRLADSYPFRRAAQLTAHVMLRGKALGQESLELMSTSNLLRTLIERIGRTTEKAKDISSDKVKKLEEAIKEMKRKQGL